MSKTMRMLNEIEEEVRLRALANGACRKNSTGMSVTPDDLREMLSLKAVRNQNRIPNPLHCFLEEFEHLEKELLELREEEKAVLLRMKEILKGSAKPERKK